MKATKIIRRFQPVPNSGFRIPGYAFRIPQSAIRNGFTLIELLIVISIIILLTTIGVGLGYKFAQAANIEQTRTSIAIIMNGVERYYDEQGEWPGAPIPPISISSGEYVYTDFLFKDLFNVTWNDDDNPDPEHDDTEFADTSIGKTSLNKLDPECVAIRHVPYSSDHDREIWAFSDAFGKVMLYSPYGALGGRPLLISAGRDGLFGPDITYYFKKSSYGWNIDTDEDDDTAADDNIRSDK